MDARRMMDGQTTESLVTGSLLLHMFVTLKGQGKVTWNDHYFQVGNERGAQNHQFLGLY